MKNGRPIWTAKCPPETLRRVEEAVDARGKTDREIYDGLNLDRFVRYATFQHWATTRRRDRDARSSSAGRVASSELGADGGQPGVRVTADQVRRTISACIGAIQDALAAGRIGRLNVGAALGNLVELSKLWIAEDINRRAAEKHAVWIEDRKKAQDAALDDVTKSTQLTAEQVAEIRLKVLGL